MPPVRRARVTRAAVVHVTVRLVDGLPSLRRHSTTERLLRIFGAECDRNAGPGRAAP